MKLSAKQLRFIMIGVLVALGVVFVMIASSGVKSLTKKSQELVDAKLKSKTADAQLASLEVAKKQVQKYSYFNDIAKTVIPSDKDQAAAVLDIFQLANQSGIGIASITFPSSTLGGSSSTSASSSGTAAISQAKPVSGITGLYSLELTIAPQIGQTISANKVVTYSKFLDFLSRIEKDRRTAQITQVSIQPQNSDVGPSNSLNFSLTINIFMRPSK